MKRTFRSTQEVLDMIKDKYPDMYDDFVYEFNGHGYNRTGEEEFIARLKKRVKGDYLLVTYYFNHPTNMCQSCWCRDVKLNLTYNYGGI